jgi:RNA-directed DNA polymerase
MTLLEQMSRGLALPIPFIKGTARKATHAYKVYAIPKRDGDARRIEHPAKPLKSLQRWLLRSVVERWPVHEAAFAYVKHRNIRDHARVHAASNYLLRMDFADFFPSIQASDIALFLATTPPGTADWTANDHDLFVQIVCRHDRLTIGAPTSPSIANAICIKLDHACESIAASLGTRYTRYADDLFFSTRDRNVLHDIPGRVAALLPALDFPRGLQLNSDKQQHSSKKRRRQVTGIVLSSDGRAVLGRERKRFIRRQIHRISTLTDKEHRSLSGLLGFAADIEPQFINALILKYGHAAVIKAQTPPPS